MKLLVGLGNPGSKYDGTRHNFGFALLDTFIQTRRLHFQSEPKFKGDLAIDSDPQHGKVLLLKPTTFMNLSGESVGSVCQFYKIDRSDVLITHDEVDLPLGTIRFARGGSAAGHNGIKSVIQHLGGENFARLKLGVGRPLHPGLAVADFVLQKFSSSETILVKDVLEQANLALAAFLQNGLDAAMGEFHRKKPD